MDDAEDQRLLAAARTGDDAALARLIERHQAQVYRFGLRMCRDEQDAADVAQDTLLSAARGLKDFRGASSVSTWLFSIARRACMKQRRRRAGAPAAHASLEDAAEAADETAPRPDDAAASSQLGRALEAAIRALDPKHREALLLRDVEGLSAAETAVALGLSVEAVKSRLHRARASVRAALAPLVDDEATAPGAPGACPDVVMMFSKKLEDEISADVCADMERHLAACPRCREKCEGLRRTLALCRTTAPDVAVPPDVQAAVRRGLAGIRRGS